MAKPKPKLSDLIVTNDEQEHLILAYHSTRLSLELSHADAVRAPSFWQRIHSAMSLHGCHGKPDPNVWAHRWQRMRSKLLVRIEHARRRCRRNTAWLTMLDSQLLTVVLDTLDVGHLEYLEQCMADDVRDADDRYVLCATVHRDMATVDERFMMRCQTCRQTFAESGELLEHIREYCAGALEELVVPCSDGDDDGDGDIAVVAAPQPVRPCSYDDCDIAMVETPQPPVVAVETSDDDDVADDGDDCANYIPPATTSVAASLEAAASAAAVAASAAPSTDDRTAIIDPVAFESLSEQSTTSHISSGDLSDISYTEPPKVYTPIACTFEGCTERFRSQAHQIAHSKGTHGQRPYPCRLCHRSFDQKITLQHHIDQHDRTFECDICQKVFPGYAGIVAHMRTHGPRVHPCRTCGRLFAVPQDAQRHHMVHDQRTKKFVCDQCGKAFHFHNKLRAHLETHIADDERKLYTCELCGASTRSKYYAAHHMLQHKVVRPYACRHKQCGESFRWYKSRVQHEISAHGFSGR